MSGRSPQRVDPLLVFDFDGTIADSMTEVLAVYNSAADGLRVPSIASADMARLRGMRPRDLLSEFRIPMWKVPLILGAVRRGMRDRMERVRPFPGVGDAIRGLREAGARCAILSSNSRENVLRFLRQNALEEFDLCRCGATLLGKAARLRALLRDAGETPQHAFYVGDEVRDVVAAKELGMRSVAVSWGYSDRSALLLEGPDFLVDTPDELRRLPFAHAASGIGSAIV
jgi:phosphoglycolate phosphatase